ncbi:MAG TPA: TrmH family RNA methyltransferase [Candidatus Limiplasma sp.]|nr:TrmH family RNA methyltransferase [Candidatus Limiplasma sp.]
MNTQKIFTKNAAYQKFEVLKTNRNKRYKYNEFFVEGVRNINEAAANGWTIVSFLYTSSKPLSDWAKRMLSDVPTEVNYDLAAGLMADISSKEDTSELLAIVKMRDDSVSKLVLSDNPLVVLLDRPSNHGNLGTILRSCDSFGIDGLLITGHAVDLYDPAVVSASMGSFFKVPAIRIADNNTLFSYLDTLKARYHGLQVVGTTAHQETSITQVDFQQPTVLMIGNETDGLNYTLKTHCDLLATIPMSCRSSASSLNIGCAATVFLYEALRQRM